MESAQEQDKVSVNLLTVPIYHWKLKQVKTKRKNRYCTSDKTGKEDGGNVQIK